MSFFLLLCYIVLKSFVNLLASVFLLQVTKFTGFSDLKTLIIRILVDHINLGGDDAGEYCSYVCSLNVVTLYLFVYNCIEVVINVLFF